MKRCNTSVHLANRAFAATGGLRWRESVLCDGDPIRVTGIARWERDESGTRGELSLG